MICKNCGANLADTAKFCKECGTPVVKSEDTPVEAPVAAPVETPVEAPAEVPAEAPAKAPVDDSYDNSYDAPASDEFDMAPPVIVKQKKNLKPLFITLGVIVAVLGALAGFIFGLRDTYKEWGGPFPYIANFADKLMLSEKEYSQKVAKNAVENGFETVTNKVNSIVKPTNTKKQINPQNMGLTAKTKIEVNDTLLDLLKNVTGTDLSFLKSLEVITDVDSASNAAKIGLEAKLNDKSIAKLSAVADFENNKAIFVTLPDLSDDALKVELPDEFFTEYDALMKQYEEMANAIDVEALSRLITTMIEVALDQVDENDYETANEKITVEGVTVNGTKVTISVTEKMLFKMLVAVMEELEGNADLKTVMQGAMKLTYEGEDFDAYFDEFYGQFEESIKMALESSKEVDVSELGLDLGLDINLWVDGKGELLGMGVDADVDGVKATVRILNVTKGKDEATEVSVNVKADGMKVNGGLFGKGTRTDGKLTGDYSIQYDKKKLVEFAVEDWAEGNGSVTIKVGKGAGEVISMVAGTSAIDEIMNYLNDGSIKLTFGSTETTSSIAIEVFYGNASLAKFSSEIIYRDLDKNFKANFKKAYDATNQSELMKFASSIDTDKLMDQLDAAGLPVDDLASMLSGLMMGSSSVDVPAVEYEDYYSDSAIQAGQNVEYFDYAA